MRICARVQTIYGRFTCIARNDAAVDCNVAAVECGTQGCSDGGTEPRPCGCGGHAPGGGGSSQPFYNLTRCRRSGLRENALAREYFAGRGSAACS
jgi:hypothetical protein